ncbi:MAG: carbonic anhydrase, partial [Schlesneria sp.]
MKTRNRLFLAILIGVICTSAISAIDQPVVVPVTSDIAQTKIDGVAEKPVTKPASPGSTSEKPVVAPDQYGNSTKHGHDQQIMTPAEALQSLKDGNKRFITDHLEKAAGKERLIELAKGQKPIAAIIACADSRVSPELIFNKGLGELFVLRVAGNVSVEAYALAGSAEYAVAHLNVPLVVVIGHETCGAVKA